MEQRIRVPEHVVYRDFGDDTVILNLETGMYHGLNGTATLMLSALVECPTLEEAIERVAAETGEPRSVIEPDLVGLCETLSERGLIERDG